MSTPNPSPTDAVAASPGISPVKLSHVFFLTRALAPMRDWYVAVLQARIAFALGNVCFLTYDSEHHRVAIVEMADAVPSAGPKRVGVNHVAFTYRDLAALVHTYRRLKAVGIAPYWTINHGVTTSMYYRDPDGNSVELQIDNFASEAETVAFMAAHLPENPVGIIVDPEVLAAQHDAGVPFDDLRRRPSLPPGMTPADMIRL
jgi:catechol 2,3-dioxygenase-like lactoylglutathione lyase family enzyme